MYASSRNDFDKFIISLHEATELKVKSEDKTVETIADVTWQSDDLP